MNTLKFNPLRVDFLVEPERPDLFLQILVLSTCVLTRWFLWPEFVQYLDETTVPIGRHREPLMVISQALLWVLMMLLLALVPSAGSSPARAGSG